MALDAHPLNAVSGIVIGSAIAVHRALGPGLLESAYQRCLERELTLRSVALASELEIPVRYRGKRLDVAIGSTLSSKTASQSRSRASNS